MAENLETNFEKLRQQIDDYTTFGQLEELTYLCGYALQKLQTLGCPITDNMINDLSLVVDKWTNKL